MKYHLIDYYKGGAKDDFNMIRNIKNIGYLLSCHDEHTLDFLTEELSNDEETIIKNSANYLEKFIEIINTTQIDINSIDHILGWKNTFLHWMVFNSCVLTTIEFIKVGKKFNPPLNINVQESSGYTPLMVAVLKGYDRCNENNCEKYKYKMGLLIKFLLQNCNNLNLDIKNAGRDNILDIALKLYDVDTIQDIYEYRQDDFYRLLKNDKTQKIITDYYKIYNLEYIKNITTIKESIYWMTGEKILEKFEKNKNLEKILEMINRKEDNIIDLICNILKN
jgi:hypothetical protein